MGIEIERKFLVDAVLWAAHQPATGHFLRQGYLLTDPNKTIRVRLTDSGAFLTIKGKNQGARRAEYEYSIPAADGQELLDSFATADLTKIRYEVWVGGKKWEVDRFLGDNEGLLVAEIELRDEGEAFELPVWAGEEVTADARYYNSNLSTRPYKQW